MLNFAIDDCAAVRAVALRGIAVAGKEFAGEHEDMFKERLQYGVDGDDRAAAASKVGRVQSRANTDRNEQRRRRTWERHPRHGPSRTMHRGRCPKPGDSASRPLFDRPSARQA
jgi:hypothetical protein